MQDELKRYAEEHRDALELYQPSDRVWERIDRRSRKGRSGTAWRQLAIAASVVLALGCGTWIYLASREYKPVETAGQTQLPLMETEVYLTALVQMRDAELDRYCRPQPELCREFDQDLEALSNAYRGLKAEYASSADKKAVLRAMASNLQLQAQLISRQLQIMETVQQKKEAYKII